MNFEEREALYARAIGKWGQGAQILKAIEELNELGAVLARDLNGRAGLVEIITELADVEIMLEQLSIIYHVDAEINAEKQRKLERLKERMGK